MYLLLLYLHLATLYKTTLQYSNIGKNAFMNYTEGVVQVRGYIQFSDQLNLNGCKIYEKISSMAEHEMGMSMMVYKSL